MNKLRHYIPIFFLVFMTSALILDLLSNFLDCTNCTFLVWFYQKLPIAPYVLKIINSLGWDAVTIAVTVCGLVTTVMFFVYGRMNLTACGIPLEMLYQTDLWRRTIVNMPVILMCIPLISLLFTLFRFRLSNLILLIYMFYLSIRITWTSRLSISQKLQTRKIIRLIDSDMEKSKVILNRDLTEPRIRWRFYDDLISSHLRLLCRNAADQDSFQTLRLLARHWIQKNFPGDPNTLFFYAFDLTEQVLLNERVTGEGAKRDKLNFLDQLLYKTDEQLHRPQEQGGGEALTAWTDRLDRVYMGMLFAIILHAQNQEILYLYSLVDYFRCVPGDPIYQKHMGAILFFLEFLYQVDSKSAYRFIPFLFQYSDCFLELPLEQDYEYYVKYSLLWNLLVKRNEPSDDSYFTSLYCDLTAQNKEKAFSRGFVETILKGGNEYGGDLPAGNPL